MKGTILLISTAIAYTVVAAKLVTIPFTAVERTGISAAGHTKLSDLVDVPLKNIDLAYLIDVEIGKSPMLSSCLNTNLFCVGSPPQPFTLLLDTGSSSTWVPIHGCGRYCGYPINSLIPSNSTTFETDNMLFSIRYGEGFSRGYYAKDTMTVNGVSVPQVVCEK